LKGKFVIAAIIYSEFLYCKEGLGEVHS